MSNNNNEMRRLEREIEDLQQKLKVYQQHMKALREKYEEEKNEILAKAAENIRAKEEALRKAKEELEALQTPPNSFGTFFSVVSDDAVRIMFRGEVLQVTAPNIDIKNIKKGQLVRLNQDMHIIEVLNQFEELGEEVRLEAVMSNDRALVSTHLEDEKTVAYFSELLSPSDVKVGDKLLMTRSHFLVERLPKSEVDDLALEEAPDITYDKIGGLNEQMGQIHDAIELPYLYPDKFREYKIRPPKGILLYGPPGCGKTMIAKAIANGLAQKVREKTGQKDLKGYFLNVRGPELLTKWVGETERKIREAFNKAREKANENCPVVIFFDEMDAIFPMRGSGISSDVEKTAVTMFCTMLDGVEEVKNVIIIGATNRQDLIDPAILRPGRLDLKIKIDRPDERGAADILVKYLTADLPFGSQYFKDSNYEGDYYVPCDKNGNPRFAKDGGKIKYLVGKDPSKLVVNYLIPRAVSRIYDPEKTENQFLEITYASGKKEIMYLKDFMSGAIIESIVGRAKKLALKRELGGGERGVRLQDLYDAIEQEFKENQDLPNTTAGIEEWLRISGKRGDRVVNVRTIIHETEKEPEKPIVNVPTGYYL